MAIVRTPPTDLGRLVLGTEPLVVVIEAVEKPGNLGAILRTADGAGVDAVIAADPGTDLYNPNAIWASLGTVFTTPVAAAASSGRSSPGHGARDQAPRPGGRGAAVHGGDLRGAIALFRQRGRGPP